MNCTKILNLYYKKKNINVAHDIQNTDIIIQVCSRVNSTLKSQIKNINPDIKFVLIEYGNKYMIDICNYLYMEKTIKENFTHDNNIEENVWISPHFEYTKDYYSLLYSCPNVDISPFIWDRFAIEQKAKECDYVISNEKVEQLNIGIFESNLLYGKLSIIPICIAETLNKTDENLIKSVHVFNIGEFSEKASFINFIKIQLCSNRTSYVCIKLQPT